MKEINSNVVNLLHHFYFDICNCWYKFRRYARLRLHPATQVLLCILF